MPRQTPAFQVADFVRLVRAPQILILRVAAAVVLAAF